MGITASTFDPNNKGASVTLSGSNLIATVSSGTGSVRGTNRVSGLTYFEMVIGATLSGSARVGLCNPSFVFTGLLGVDANGVGYDSGGTVKINNATVATIATYAAGNNIGVAVDPLRELIWFRVNGGNWNNDVIANQNPVGAVGGISISSAGGNWNPAWGGSATSSATGVFASGSWTYAAPTGFSSPDSFGASAVDGMVAKRTTGFTQYGAAKAVTPSISQRVAVLGPLWRGTKTISGQTQENGVAVSGKQVFLYDTKTGVRIGSAISDGSGNFSIPALGRTNVFAVCLDPTYQAIVYDQVVPV